MDSEWLGWRFLASSRDWADSSGWFRKWCALAFMSQAFRLYSFSLCAHSQSLTTCEYSSSRKQVAALLVYRTPLSFVSSIAWRSTWSGKSADKLWKTICVGFLPCCRDPTPWQSHYPEKPRLLWVWVRPTVLCAASCLLLSVWHLFLLLPWTPLQAIHQK